MKVRYGNRKEYLIMGISIIIFIIGIIGLFTNHGVLSYF